MSIMRVQPTPLCGPKIVAILKVGSVPSTCAIYRCGAADAQAVRQSKEKLP